MALRKDLSLKISKVVLQLINHSLYSGILIIYVQNES